MGETAALVTTVIGIVTAIVAPVTAIATALTINWVKARQQLHSEQQEQRKADFAEQQHDDLNAKEAYKILVDNLTKAVHDITEELKSVQGRELECVKAYGEVRGELTRLNDEVQMLRAWRHELANIAHTEAMKKLEESKMMEVATAAASAVVSEQQHPS